MSHSHEPSYYEIALTNRQVVIVFVVLLVCVVVAFFSGVWVGRSNPAAPIAEVAEQRREAGGETSGEQAPVGELHFFAEREGQGAESQSLAELAEEPQGETTLFEDLGGPESDSAAEKPSATQRQSPTVTASPEPRAAAAEVGGYVIQVFSSADETQARKLLDQLSGRDYPAFLSPVEVGNQTMMRVRIGPFAELKEAERVAERIRQEFKLDTWVTR